MDENDDKVMSDSLKKVDDFIPIEELPPPGTDSVKRKLSDTSSRDAKGVKKKKTLNNPVLPKNALCKLNEMFRGLVFQTVNQEGPIHAPIFTIAVKINDKVFEGRGKSKKIAKHNAAEAALRTLTQFTDIRDGGFKFYSSNDPTDFTSDISYKEVNSFEAGKTVNNAAANNNSNGLSEIRKPAGLKPAIRPADKSPVMLLNELHPNIKYDIVSENVAEHNRYTTEVTISNQRFRGTGPSKKLSKAAAARSALAALHNISFSAIELNGGANSSHSFGSEIPQVFADHVSRLLVQKFVDVIKNNLAYARKKVLAGVVLSKGYDCDSCRVISVSTGTKCINGEYLSTYGTVVQDSHAEIISRRCIMNFLYSELEKHLTNFNGQVDSILESVPEGQGFRLKDNYLFHLFINTAPCGDSRIFSPHDERLVDRHPNRKARGQLRTKIECGEGTIPVKYSEAIQTWDGVLQGERLLTMSCSDKIAKWNVLGVQGALLSNFLEPIYLHSIILGSLYHPEHLTRALYGRIEKVLQALPPPYRLNKPKMALISNKEERQVGKPPMYSVNWTEGDENAEIVSSVTGKTEQNEVSRLAKCKMFDRFMALVGNIPSATVRSRADCPRSYRECKESAVMYKSAKVQLYKAFQKANLGRWVQKPFEADDFELKADDVPGIKD